MKYAVIYARYSSDRQNEMSIDGQIAECRRYAEAHDMVVVQEYIDKAQSATTDKRPSFLRMIKDSEERTFDTILVYQLDRFARNKDDSGYYKKILRDNGVKVISAMEQIASDSSGVITEGMLEIVADWYSKQLSEKVTRGLYQRAELKKFNGGQMPLGYTKGEDGYYALDPQTAPVIKEIFQRISEGETAVSVMEDLNKRGIKTAQGKPFTKNSLYAILRNERYAGVYIYGDIRIEDGMPRIISNELFEEVREVLATHKHRGRRRPKEDDYILTGKLFCGKCKSPMYGLSGTSSYKGIVHRYYSCKEKPKNCDKKNVRKERIEKLIVKECQKLISDDIIDALIKNIELANKSDQQGPEIIRLQKEVKSVDNKIEKLLSQIESGVTSDRIIERLRQREEELQNLKKQLKVEEGKQKILDPDIVRRFLKDLRKGNIENQNYRKSLVNIFIDKIYLYDDHFRIILNYNPGDRISDNEAADIERYFSGKPLENSVMEAQIQPIAGIVREYPDTAHHFFGPRNYTGFFFMNLS